MGFEMIILAIMVPLFLVFIWMIFAYNSLQKGRIKVENSWGQINVQLKIRSDLVPNLVNIVSGYAKHEQETLTKVIQARNNFLTAKNARESH
ncbi:LemA family protein [Cellulosilyticum sp. I15G10I2]|uniref:LemA family protein n=1 Tax=Cellulosilyticum sp. I15G10I2 TaxID=1892843 RepID=UPI002101878E|nr:LemA family protein [Cellulosilyticum sp. I15G10I2]